MPNEPAEEMHIAYTPEFKRNLRALAKKYRHIRSDVQPVIDKIYHLKSPTNIILVTVYSKLDQADISPKAIRRIMKEFDEYCF